MRLAVAAFIAGCLIGGTFTGLAFSLAILFTRWTHARDLYYPGWHTTLPRLVLDWTFTPVFYAGACIIVLAAMVERWYDAVALKFTQFLRS